MAEPKETVHGGDIYRNPSVTDYSVNSNPLGVPEAVRKSVQESADRIMYYPDVRCDRLRESISDFERIEKEKILCGNGAAELFFAVVMAVRPKKALVTAPAFSEYERALGTVGAEVQYYRCTPNGTALGFSFIRDTENGPEWVAFSAALKLDYSIDYLIFTPLSGQNPLTNETVPLVLTHSYG
mgnify:CR=1 FL=1